MSKKSTSLIINSPYVAPGKNQRIAVKIVDNQEIESLRVLDAPSQESKS